MESVNLNQAKILTVGLLCALLAACGSQPTRTSDSGGTPTRGGGYYKDDGPGDNEPNAAALAAIPDAQPRAEPLHRYANNPYTVLGRDYTPMKNIRPYKTTGTASWYGKKFHGQKTSTGETYDMYGMTAAHPTLPLPSYARVTSESNGKSVIVRVNDRGPFHADRIIDLSYAAAWKLGLIATGSGRVTVELIDPGSELPPPPKPVSPEPAPVIASTAPPYAPPSSPSSATTANAANVPTPPASPSPFTPAPKAAAGAAPAAYIQLGAFSNPDNAEVFRNHMAREFDWLADRLRSEPGGNVMRVQAGPFRDRAEAEAYAERIRAATGGVKPLVLMR